MFGITNKNTYLFRYLTLFKKVCDYTLLYKGMKKNLSVIISLIALVLSVYASFVCDKRLEADWMGVIVGILSLLVTTLIGWNIYNLIDINQTRKQINQVETKLSSSLETSLYEVQMTAFFVFLNKEHKTSDDYFHLWLHGLSAMNHLTKVGKYQDCSDLSKMILNEVNNLKNTDWNKTQLESLMELLLSMNDAKNIEEFPTLCGILWGYPALKKN